MSVGLEGMKGHEIFVEADVRDEKEFCVIIGLPDVSIKESKERILSCLHNLKLDMFRKLGIRKAFRRMTLVAQSINAILYAPMSIRKSILSYRPMKKITIHLSPADRRKSGTGHDCAMLIAVLQKVLEEPLPIEDKTCF